MTKDDIKALTSIIDKSFRKFKKEMREEMNISHKELKDELMLEIRRNGVAIEENGHRIDFAFEGIMANQEAIKRIEKRLAKSNLEMIPVHAGVLKRHSKRINQLEKTVYTPS